MKSIKFGAVVAATVLGSFLFLNFAFAQEPDQVLLRTERQQNHVARGHHKAHATAHHRRHLKKRGSHVHAHDHTTPLAARVTN